MRVLSHASPKAENISDMRIAMFQDLPENQCLTTEDVRHIE